MDWTTKCNYLKRNPVTVARQIDHIFRKLWGKVILSGLHPIGQILNFDDRREFQNRGIEHFHAPIHVVDAPRIDKDDDRTVTEFIDKYITCSLPDKSKFSEFHDLVKKVQTHRHTPSCKKTNKAVVCRFDAPWPPSEKTMIVRGDPNLEKEDQIKWKKVLNKVLATALSIPDLSVITFKTLLAMSNVSTDEYEQALCKAKKKTSIVYKRKPEDVNIGPYNPVILASLRANMNIQYVTGVYAMLTYLTSYLCKPEHTMSEFMKKASKEAYGSSVKEKMRKIGNVFLQKEKFQHMKQ